MAMTQIVLKIQGLTCINCANKVEASLRSLDGITDLSIDHKKGLAKITYDGTVLTNDDLIRAVVDAGYRAEVKRGLFG